jgi:fucose permease
MAGLAAAALVVAAVAPTFPSAAVALLVAAFALAGIFPTVLGMAGAQFPTRTGTVFGVLFTLALTGGMTLPGVAGHLAAASGVRAVLVLGAAGFVAVTLLGLRAGRLSRAA